MEKQLNNKRREKATKGSLVDLDASLHIMSTLLFFI